MPLPVEILDNIKRSIDEAEATIKSIEDVVADLRAGGIDASAQEESLRNAKNQLAQLRVFYGRQKGR